MLVLTRRSEQEIRIGGNVRVRVLSISGNQVRLGIEAPPDVTVHRGELVEAVELANQAAGHLAPERVAALLPGGTTAHPIIAAVEP
jgi:carbon storage regulator